MLLKEHYNCYSVCVKANEQHWPEDVKNTVTSLSLSLSEHVFQTILLPWKQHPFTYTLDLTAAANADTQTGA